jgi:hypothetical protein
MPESNGRIDRSREWKSLLAIAVSGLGIFLTLSGLSIWLLPFSLFNQLLVLAHIGAGLVFVIPCVWYVIRHWRVYRSHMATHIQIEGYIGGAALLACVISGVVVTFQAIWGLRMSYLWDTIHIITTVAVLAFIAMHVGFIVVRDLKARAQEAIAAVLPAMRTYFARSAVLVAGLVLVVAAAGLLYRPIELSNEFPPDYSYSYGPDRPFAPSLARTDTGKAFDVRSLSGSSGCGTPGCHQEIYQEWTSSAHRYAAMDPAFQAIQSNMAKQNGPDSTRYCGGCHDPISIFAGAKTIFADPEKLSSAVGYQEGVSCLACHAVRETDVKGNAAYIITQPARYIGELEYAANPGPVSRWTRDILIRSYPRFHVASLSKRLYKSPAYCAACHKQFIDQEINNVGWVQLQNQYDNWRKSKWNHPGDAGRTVECRECHMPLQPSLDPASGDAADYNRRPDDNKHRSHRFLAANQMIPAVLKLEGWEKHVELTNQWLRGELEVPEIAGKWARGNAVGLDLIVPKSARPGDKVPLKTVITANKVGHDYPTGPLDIIQSWVEIVVTDDHWREIFSSGKVDARGFIEPGSFIFKAEPVDQAGNLIDRHNLWEMVGVRHRRALFPGFSDTANFELLCPNFTVPTRGPAQRDRTYEVEAPAGKLHVRARLRYRKVDQYLLNFIFGEKSGLTAPITDMATVERTVTVF